MQKWEYMLLVLAWDNEKQEFYWGDNATDARSLTQRLNAHGQEGWELVSGHTSGRLNEQFNYLLKRPVS